MRQYLEGNGGAEGDRLGNNRRQEGGGPGGGDNGNNGGGSGRGGGGGGRGGRGDPPVGLGGQAGRGGLGGTSSATTAGGRGKGAKNPVTAAPAIVNMDVDKGKLSRSTVLVYYIEDLGCLAQTSTLTVSASTVTSNQRPTSHVTTSRPPAISSAGPRVVVCECGMPAAKKTNTTGGSKGRSYYGCSKDKCEFYQWADGTSSSSAVPTKRPFSQVRVLQFWLSSAYLYEDQTDDAPDKPVRRCRCDTPGVLLTVHKEGETQGQKFWKCQNTQKQGDCGFFEWDHEPHRGASASVGGAGGGAGSGGAGGGSGARKCFKVSKTTRLH